MKKTIALLLALIMLLSAVPAFASNTHTNGLYTYEIKDDDTITITKFDWSHNEGDINVPDTIDGYTVTAIGDGAFDAEYNLLDVYFGKAELYSKESVGVMLPNTIVSIGNFAFRDANLSFINLPENLQHIGDGAFIDCNKIQFKIASIHPKFAVIDGALYGKENKELIFAPLTEELKIPEGIVSIRNYAMYHSNMENQICDMKIRLIGDTSISAPSTLESIGDYAFSGRSLNGNLFREGVVSIGESAFEDCELGNVRIPTTITTLGKKAFANVEPQKVGQTITIPANSQLTVIPAETFINVRHSIHIESANLKEVGDYAFAGLKNDTGNDYYVKVEIGADTFQNIEKLGDYAFFTDSPFVKTGTTIVNYENIVLSSQLTTLPAGFNMLVEIPDNITTISSQAFTENISVVDYYLPNTISEIEADAFPKISTFIVDAGSYAEQWCNENGFGYTVEGQEDDLSWLNG